MQRIGIYGGSFDPVHYGHLIAASHAADYAKLDSVIFVPAFRQPVKETAGVCMTAFEHRLYMTVLAVAGDNRFSVSDIERTMGGKSYTVNTLRAIAAISTKDSELFFITGMDAACDLLAWHKPDEILAECRILVANRSSEKSIQPVYDALGQCAIDGIKFYDSPVIDISATIIRERVKARQSIRYLTPASVEKYIYDNELYYR